MTKKLLFNSDTTYIFNHPHFYKEFAGKPCKVVNWNPPNLYTIEFEDGRRMLETEANIQECLSEFQNFSVGDIVYFCKPESPHYKQRAKVIQTSPNLCVRLFSQPFDFVPIEVEPNDIKDIDSWTESNDSEQSDEPIANPSHKFQIGQRVKCNDETDIYFRDKHGKIESITTDGRYGVIFDCKPLTYLYSPDKLEPLDYSWEFYPGDVIRVIKSGDIGTVTYIDGKNNHVSVWFDFYRVSFHPRQIEKVDPSFLNNPEPYTPPVEFKLGDEVESLLPRDNYLDFFSCGKIGTIVEINSHDNPKEYHIKFTSYSAYGNEDYHQWVNATQIKKTKESTLPNMNLILKEGMIVKVADSDATHVVIHSEPYLSNLNTDHDLCLLNTETLQPIAIGDRQILKVWGTDRKLVYDAIVCIIASLKRQAESILAKIKELEAAKVL